MRTFSIAAMTLTSAAALSLAACSDKTQDKAAQTASSAANDVSAAADDVSAAATDVSAAASEAVHKAGAAANTAAVAADKMGAHIKQGAAEAEDELRHESPARTKRD